MTSIPDPRTPTVRPPALSAPRCAAASTPRARPLTMVSPAAARSPASRSATLSAYGEAARAPTIATPGVLRTPALPRIQRTNGGSGIVVSAAGYAGSLHVTGVARTLCAASTTRAASARNLDEAPGAVPGFAQASSSAVRGGKPRRSRSAEARQHEHGVSERATKYNRSSIGSLDAAARPVKKQGGRGRRASFAGPDLPHAL